jgi:hypothetical protein
MCEHDLAERETACADGKCPICLETRLKALIEAVEEVKEIDERDAITETMKMANYAISFVSTIEELYQVLQRMKGEKG